MLNLNLCSNLARFDLSQACGYIDNNARINGIKSHVKFYSINSTGISMTDFNMTVPYANAI